MIPIVQREVNTFVDVVWNSHRIREQKNTFLPDGVPNHIYSFPEKYGLEECGTYQWLCSPSFSFSLVVLLEHYTRVVPFNSDVLADNDDYLSAEFRNKCEQVIADPLEIAVSDFAYAFRYLKENVDIHVHA